MIHFVPAWYNPQRRWYSTDDVWFRSAIATEADDTVTQLRTFRQGSEEAALIVLHYAPNLRRFLHGQGIADVPYWSFFDEIQGLGDDYTRPLDFLELDWPEDVGFFYNPFVVTVMRGSDVYARIHLGREGTLQSIRFFGDGMPTLERIFDDRGFLSSVLMHDEDGRPLTQYYLSRGGDVIVSEDVPSGRIDVVQNEDDRFRQNSYASWEELMGEFLGARLDARRGQGDTVVVALCAQHDELVRSLLTDQTLVLSRSQARPAHASDELLQRAGAVFSDAGGPTAGGLEPSDEPDGWAVLPVLSIYPLERRPTFGASANEATVFISVFVDGMTMTELDFVIASLAMQLVKENTRLQVCTFRSQDLDYLQEIKRVIAGYQVFDLGFLGDDAGLNLYAGADNGPEEKIQLAFLDQEAELIRTMARSRVLIDLGTRVNPRLAAEAVNAGVPQINRYDQDLCTHPINGYVIADDSELATAADWFLSGLERWNQSLVQCRVLGDLFSAQEILGRWDLIKEVVAYADPADRP